MTITHRQSNTRLYRTWTAMRSRCHDKQRLDYKHYGGRGIHVCSRWDSYEIFAEDMGPHPGKGWELDRINNDGNYELTNCRWSTRLSQIRNRRSIKLSFESAQEIRQR